MTKAVASVFVAVAAALGGVALRYVHGAAVGPQPLRTLSQTPRPRPRGTEARSKSPAGAPSQRPLPAEYRVIGDRNIFASPQSHAAAGAPATQPSGSATFVLKGISQRGHEFVAFVERGDTRQILELRVNNTLGRGRVRGMTLQSLDYEDDGKLTRVEVGHPLGGTLAGAAPAPVAAAPAPAAALTTTRPARAAPAGPERGGFASGARAKKP